MAQMKEQNPSGVQHQGNSWKDTSSLQGEIEVTGNRASTRRQLLPDKNPEARQQHCPLSESSPSTHT